VIAVSYKLDIVFQASIIEPRKATYGMPSSNISPPHMLRDYIDRIWSFYCWKREYGILRELVTMILLCLKDMEANLPTKHHIRFRISNIQTHLADISAISADFNTAIAEYTAVKFTSLII
jgi:hypothetical protein